MGIYRTFDKKVTISYYALGSRNDLGEPSRTLTERASSVPCRFDWRSALLSYEWPALLRQQMKSGVVNSTTHALIVKSNQTLEENDIITDSDGVTYLVAAVRTVKSHKEALLQKEA